MVENISTGAPRSIQEGVCELVFEKKTTNGLFKAVNPLLISIFLLIIPLHHLNLGLIRGFFLIFRCLSNQYWCHIHMKTSFTIAAWNAPSRLDN